jgi:hypothetical protein
MKLKPLRGTNEKQYAKCSKKKVSTGVMNTGKPKNKW